MRTMGSAAVMVAMLLGAATVTAHHSYAEFRDQPIALDGTLDRVVFGNPHTLLTIHDRDHRTHTIIWNAAFQLQTQGVHPTDLKVGDDVELIGYPSRDPELHQMAKLRKVRRLNDGWTWQMVNGRVTVGRTSE